MERTLAVVCYSITGYSLQRFSSDRLFGVLTGARILSHYYCNREVTRILGLISYGVSVRVLESPTTNYILSIAALATMVTTMASEFLENLSNNMV